MKARDIVKGWPRRGSTSKHAEPLNLNEGFFKRIRSIEPEARWAGDWREHQAEQERKRLMFEQPDQLFIELGIDRNIEWVGALTPDVRKDSI